ncbi:MAG TPA: hypothetical protein VJ777_05995 [Mycobacterium sp.]|nr:hypothetical protein [Mycobacterium sp.]
MTGAVAAMLFAAVVVVTAVAAYPAGALVLRSGTRALASGVEGLAAGAAWDAGAATAFESAVADAVSARAVRVPSAARALRATRPALLVGLSCPDG